MSLSESFLCINDLHFYSNIYSVIHILGVSFVPTDVRALKLPPLQKSRYLGTCVLCKVNVTLAYIEHLNCQICWINSYTYRLAICLVVKDKIYINNSCTFMSSINLSNELVWNPVMIFHETCISPLTVKDLFNVYKKYMYEQICVTLYCLLQNNPHCKNLFGCSLVRSEKCSFFSKMLVYWQFSLLLLLLLVSAWSFSNFRV